MDKMIVLKSLNELLVKIESKTKKIESDKKKQVALYDKWTKQVNAAVKEFIKTKQKPEMKGWDILQKQLFGIYKQLI